MVKTPAGRIDHFQWVHFCANPLLGFSHLTLLALHLPKITQLVGVQSWAQARLPSPGAHAHNHYSTRVPCHVGGLAPWQVSTG